jgi:flavin-dependent dehydrogenase
MTDEKKIYDCAVIGGGLAGLCLSIQLSRLGRSVIVFEKNKYPFHKVCGEYVSNEIAGFLLRLGLRLDEWDLPQISHLGISSEEGFMLNSTLDLGGFGISRYKLDAELQKLALESGVKILEGTKVTDVSAGNVFTNKGRFQCRVAVGAFGKSNPLFAGNAPGTNADDNYVGVKYHVLTDFPSGRIELHNFRRGYCGISRIEDNRYCLCYISHASNLARSNNSIEEMEQKVLSRNPHLKKILSGAQVLFEKPLTISNIRFSAKKTSDDNLIYLGDAAGCISPLTGNGMSMSGYASVLLAGLLERHFTGDLSRQEATEAYRSSWESTFSSRIRRGRQLQTLFGKPYLSDIALRMLNPLGKIKNRIIASTHGVPF